MKLSLLSAAALLFPMSAFAAGPAEWRSQSIYFVLTDRFAVTDGSTDAPCDTGARVRRYSRVLSGTGLNAGTGILRWNMARHH